MKKFKSYYIASLIVFLIFLIIFVVKGIFPFGENSLIYSDMHDQITAFYYHFYDSIVGKNSLFVNFSTSGGINFFGIMAYYIISPFNFLLFLFDRDKIYLAVSLIVVFKVLMTVLTSLYFINTYYKKIPNLLKIALALLYGFSGYTMSMYLITPWMDAMYMLPLILTGLRKVLDLESPTFYIFTLTISIILCFYISYMIIIFIFFASLIYLLVYKNKEERKKAIVMLGVTTVLSLLLSLFIVYPAYDQISLSSRLSSSFDSILNSKTGPIIDKTSFFTSSALYFVGVILLLFDYKNNKKFLLWYIPTCMIVLIPYIIEPVNKIWHFGTYAFFPYRFSFIAIFMLLIGSANYFNNNFSKFKERKGNFRKFGVTVLGIIFSLIIVFVSRHFYQKFQFQINKLSISGDKLLILLLLVMMLLTMIVIYVSIKVLGKTKFAQGIILTISIVNITAVSFFYFGMDFDQKRLNSVYKDLQLIEKDYHDKDFYRVKNTSLRLITNNGMVMRYHNLDHFTSLTDGNNMKTLKLLGFNSTWTKIYSSMATTFSDYLLANKYLIKEYFENNDDNYEYVKSYGTLDFYKLKNDISYGYFVDKNISIVDKKDTFDVQNSIYKAITKDGDLFTIYDSFDNYNLEIKEDKDSGVTSYKIIDDDEYSYLEKDINIVGLQRLYFNLYYSLINVENYEINDNIDIYVNGKLMAKNFPNQYYTGTLDCGTYENEIVTVRIVFKKSLSLKNISAGVMNIEKLNNFVEKEKINSQIDFSKNKVKVRVESDGENLLFIPVTYSDGYSVRVNGVKRDVIKVFDNYLGVYTDDGVNNITFTFVPPKFKVSCVISIITLIVTIILIKYNLFLNIRENKVMKFLAEKVYLSVYLFAIILMYIVPTICFILSYFINF